MFFKRLLERGKERLRNYVTAYNATFVRDGNILMAGHGKQLRQWCKDIYEQGWKRPSIK